MKRKVLAVLLTLVMIVVMASGCATSGGGEDVSETTNEADDSSAKEDANSNDTSSETSSEEAVTIKLLNKYPEESYKVYFEKAIADFETIHPNINIEMESVSDEAIKDKLSVIASGGDMPDIFFSWSGEYVKKFARAGLALDLTSYLEADQEWAGGFMKAFLNNSTFDGHTYAIPYRSGVMFMMYNKEVFETNNIEIPKTWDEFLGVCDSLLTKDITPIAFGDSSPWYGAWWIGQLNAMLVDPKVLTTDYNPESGAFTDANYVKSIQMFQELNDKGYFGDHVNSKDYYQVQQQFCVGQCGMQLDMTADFAKYTEIMGSEDKWGIFKVPTIEGAAGDPGFITGGTEVYCVASTCENPDEAVEFIKFMTSYDQAVKQTVETGLPNALINGITEENSTPALAAAYKEAESYTNIADWLDCAVEAKVADQYLVSIQECLEGKDAKEIMQEVQKVAEAVKADME